MKKQVVWPSEAHNSNPGSMVERVAENQRSVDAQRGDQDLLQKAEGPMRALLQVRLANKTPLKVMRGFAYPSSALAGQEEDDGFYQIQKSEHALGKFVDTQVQIPPGEELILKSLYPAMREFIFADSKGKEHAISYDQTHLLMLNTDIYETVQEFMGRGQ